MFDGGLLLSALTEPVVVLWMFWRRRAVRGRVLAGVDVAFAMLALVAMVALTPGSAPSAWVNWACPFSHGSVVIALLAFRRPTGGDRGGGGRRGEPGDVTSSLTAGKPDLLATPLANAMTYIGRFVAGTVVFGVLRRSAAEADDARAEAVTRGARLATERERNAQHVLHDSTPQTLEIVARSNDPTVNATWAQLGDVVDKLTATGLNDVAVYLLGAADESWPSPRLPPNAGPRSVPTIPRNGSTKGAPSWPNRPANGPSRSANERRISEPAARPVDLRPETRHGDGR